MKRRPPSGLLQMTCRPTPACASDRASHPYGVRSSAQERRTEAGTRLYCLRVSAEPTTKVLPKVVSREEWEQARAELLAKEKAATRARDALATERRRQPMGPRRKGLRLSGLVDDSVVMERRLVTRCGCVYLSPPGAWR